MVLIDKVTHGANLLVCVAGVATATGLVAGAGAGIGGLLSLREISRRLPPQIQPLADEIASRLQKELTANHLPDAHRTLIPQMIEMSVPDANEVMAAGKRVEPLIDTMIGKLTDPSHQPALLQDNFRAVLRGPLETLLDDPAYADQLSAAFQTVVMHGLAEANRKLDLLLERSEATARKLGVNEGLVIGLARRYAGGDHGDFDSAYRGLERALEVAAERPQASNISAEVDAIVAEVDRLTR